MKIRCFKCNGRGKILDIGFIIGTCLIGLIDPYNECDVCNGKGYINDKDK